MFFAVWFTLSQFSPPVRNATHLRTFCFLEVIIFCLCRDLCQPACLFAAQFTLKTALNYHEGCNEFADRLFERSSLWIIFPFERLFVLCQPLIRSLCFIQVYIFIPPDTFCPILGLFTHFAYTNFFICILPCGIFLLFLMTPLIGESSEFNFNF